MNTIATLEMMAQEAGRAWNITCVHLERVKSFSPGVVHVVLDVLCSVRIEDDASGTRVIQ
jgi:tRNA G37 N-methylase Trm5